MKKSQALKITIMLSWKEELTEEELEQQQEAVSVLKQAFTPSEQ